MNKICLFGASGHGKVITEIAHSINRPIIAFFDDNPSVETLLNIPVFSAKKIKEYCEFQFVISIGNNKIRKNIAENLNAKFTKLIHKSAVCSDTSEIKDGSVVMANATINAEVRIGKHGIINTGSIIEHECQLEDYVHLSPNATLTGNVYVGEGTHIGAGAVVIPNIQIGKWATIGAGAVIINDVPDYAVVVGNPGKIIKYNNTIL